MAQHTDIEPGQALVIFHEKIGFVRAWGIEKHENNLGTSALTTLIVNSKLLPGVDRMQINTNIWDVWDENDLKVLQKIADHFVGLERPF